MRQQDQIGLGAFDHLTQRDRKTVRRVFFEQVVFDEKYFVELITGELVRERRDAFADDDAGDGGVRLRGDLLRRRERLKADVVPFAVRAVR